MDHIVILKEPYFSLLLSGKKTIESRWYMTKKAPWNKVKKGEIIYFKPSSNPVLARAKISNITQFDSLTPQKVKEIINSHQKICFVNKELSFEENKFKKYCVLIEFSHLEMVLPFNIDKSGFGNQSAWISVEDITVIKK